MTEEQARQQMREKVAEWIYNFTAIATQSKWLPWSKASPEIRERWCLQTDELLALRDPDGQPLLYLRHPDQTLPRELVASWDEAKLIAALTKAGWVRVIAP